MPAGRPVRPEAPRRSSRGEGAQEPRGRGDPGLPPPLPLAHGALSEEDDRELQALKEQIRTESGLFCQGYKEKCLRRRIGVRMRARGVHRYADYARLLDDDPGEYRRLLDTVTINVSKFFRNAEMWQLLRDRVVPELMEGRDAIRVWSAGAASGEEAYTVAIAFLEHARREGREHRLRDLTIEGTDIDERALERARAAEYGALALAETTEDVRERWFERRSEGVAGDRFRVRDEVRRLVRFRQADLIREAFPGGLDLVFCRNVFIYFERELQEELLWRFHQALRPGGYLVLGKVETLLGPVVGRLETISARERIYRKP